MAIPPEIRNPFDSFGSPAWIPCSLNCSMVVWPLDCSISHALVAVLMTSASSSGVSSDLLACFTRAW